MRGVFKDGDGDCYRLMCTHLHFSITQLNIFIKKPFAIHAPH